MIPTIRSHVAAILFPLAVLAAISTGLAPGVCAPASVADEPAELSEARARYEKDVEIATRPLRDRYVQALERIMKSLTLRGDLAGALMVQKEMEPFASGVGIARFAGDWGCQFVNGAVHHYTIDPDGTIFWTDPTPKQKLKTVMKGKDYLIEFPGDDIVERLTVSGSELQFEHFTPKSTYPGKTATRGTGKRVPKKK